MQEQTWRPSSSTVQAPQSPASQPTLVPVSESSSRNTWESRRIGSVRISAGLPLRVKETVDCVAIMRSRAQPASGAPG